MAQPTAPNYPTSLDDETSLFAYTNTASYTLTGDISNSVTNFTVNEVIDDFQVPGFLKFASGETIYVEASTPATKTFSSITRGVAGTVATTHATGEEMRGILVAEILEQIRDAIIAIETELGTLPSTNAYSNVRTRLNVNHFEATYMNKQTLSANKTLVNNDYSLQVLTPSGANRTVQLPAEGPNNHLYIIHNPDPTYNLIIQNDTPTVLETLLEDEAAICVSDGTNWHALKTSIKKDTYLYLGELRSDSGGTLTISTGAITVAPRTNNVSFYTVAAESGTSDDLSTINGGAAGDVIILVPDTGDTITFVAGTGSGAINMPNDVVLSPPETIMLRHDGTEWAAVGPFGSGKKSFVIPALAFLPSDLDDTISGIRGTVHPAYSFLDAVSNNAFASIPMPHDWDGGNLSATIQWLAGATGTNSVVWQLSIAVIGDGTAWSAWEDVETVVDAAQNSTTILLVTSPVTLVPTSSFSPGDSLIVEIERLGTNGSDTLAATAWFVGVKIEYTAKKEAQ